MDQSDVMGFLCTLLALAPPRKNGLSVGQLCRIAVKVGAHPSAAKELVHRLIESGEFEVEENGDVFLPGCPYELGAAVVLAYAVYSGEEP